MRHACLNAEVKPYCYRSLAVCDLNRGCSAPKARPLATRHKLKPRPRLGLLPARTAADAILAVIDRKVTARPFWWGKPLNLLDARRDLSKALNGEC